LESWHEIGLIRFAENAEEEVCHGAVAARAVEASDIVLNVGDKGTEGDRAVGAGWGKAV
jgi:hypothetical protein